MTVSPKEISQISSKNCWLAIHDTKHWSLLHSDFLFGLSKVYTLMKIWTIKNIVWALNKLSSKVNAQHHNWLNSVCNNGYVYVKQHENNNNKNQEREGERECSYASNCSVEFVIPWQNDRTGQWSFGQSERETERRRNSETQRGAETETD